MGFRNQITTLTDDYARTLAEEAKADATAASTAASTALADAAAAQAAAVNAQSTADEALTGIIPGSRLAADAIDGRVITGSTLRTAAEGQRIQIDSGSGLVGYNAAGAAVTQVAADTGKLTATGATIAGTIETAGAREPRVRIKQTALFGGATQHGSVQFLGTGTADAEQVIAHVEAYEGSDGLRLLELLGGSAVLRLRGTEAEIGANRLTLPADTRIGGKVNPADYFCEAWQDTPQNLANGAWAPILLQAENYDLGGFHAPDPYPSRMTAPVYGIYEVSGLVAFAVNSNGIRATRYNYAHSASSAPVIVRGAIGSVVPAREVTAAVAAPKRFTMQAGGWIELQGFQNSGVTLGTQVNADTSSAFSIQLVKAL